MAGYVLLYQIGLSFIEILDIFLSISGIVVVIFAFVTVHEVFLWNVYGISIIWQWHPLKYISSKLLAAYAVSVLCDSCLDTYDSLCGTL